MRYPFLTAAIAGDVGANLVAEYGYPVYSAPSYSEETSLRLLSVTTTAMLYPLSLSLRLQS